MSNKLNYYRSELKSKNIPQYKMVGITSELILNTSIFSKNEDIVPFLENVYRITYREYVIKSRTLILARTVRHIYSLDNKEYEVLRKRLLSFVNGYLEISANNNDIKTSNIDFRKWMDGIANADR